MIGSGMPETLVASAWGTWRGCGVEALVAASNLFNSTLKQAYMDNSLHGGMPLVLGDLDDSMRQPNSDEDSRLKVYHVYSRIHGNLERDYNDFVIDPTHFSQGPGNFRTR